MLTSQRGYEVRSFARWLLDRVVLTALVRIPGRGTAVAMAAASGGSSSSGAARKLENSCAAFSPLPKHSRRQEREIVRLRATREIVLNVGENRVE